MLTRDEQRAQLKIAPVYIETIRTKTPPCALEGPSDKKTAKIDRNNLYLSGSRSIIVLKRYPSDYKNLSQVKDDRVTNRQASSPVIYSTYQTQLQYTIYRTKLELKMSASMPRLLH